MKTDYSKDYFGVLFFSKLIHACALFMLFVVLVYNANAIAPWDSKNTDNSCSIRAGAIWEAMKKEEADRATFMGNMDATFWRAGDPVTETPSITEARKTVYMAAIAAAIMLFAAKALELLYDWLVFGLTNGTEQRRRREFQESQSKA